MTRPTLLGARRRGTLVGWLMVIGLAAAPAAAGELGVDGHLVASEDALLTIGLDGYGEWPSGFELTLYDASYEPMSVPQTAIRFHADRQGLEGQGALNFGGDALYGTFTLQGLGAQLDGRRAELRIWQRPDGSRASLDLYFYGGDIAYAFETGDYSGLWYPGMVSFRPTGRYTSDGWEEWSTGVFEVPADGAFHPAIIQMYDQQLRPLQQSYAATYGQDLGLRLDAFEVIDHGESLVPQASCTLASEAEVCGDEGLCLYGRCADARIVAGAPPLPGREQDYLERRLFEVTTFSGGRLPQSRMDGFADTLEGLMADPAPARFWPRYRAAVNDLRDGHASAPWAGYPAQAGLGICAHHGRADLLPGGEALPLVFETNQFGPVASMVEVGDAITAIDGLPPSAWAYLASRLVLYPGDPAGFDVVTAPVLLNAAAVAGSVVELSRCAGGLDGQTPCSEGEVERFEIDLGALVGEALYGGQVPAWSTQSLTCDYRFERPVVALNNREGAFAGYADDDEADVRTLVINAVPALQGEAGQLWGAKVREALTPAPNHLILDQRLGQGGSVDAVDLLAGLLVSPSDFSHMAMLPATDRAVDDALLGVLDDCLANDEVGVGCGAYFSWELGETLLDEGSSAQARLAVLIGSDVSGNDFTSKLLSYRSGATRIFGAAPTWGAFGVIWSLPTWDEELAGGSFQVHDTLFVDGAGVSGTFTTGVGVAPDVVVLQTQSDVLAGRDTLLEAARAWVVP